MFGIVINQNGFKVTFCPLNEDKTTQYYDLQDGETVIEQDWNMANGMNKPKWDGEKWIDTEPIEIIPQTPMVDKIDILKEKIGVIKDYKWDVSARGFEYDGYIQSNRERDCTMMYRCRMGLELGVEPFIPWKLPDNTYAIITDYNYFLEMEILSTRIIQKCFGIEEIILAELKLLETIEELLAYNEKARFDELFAMS